MRYSLPFDDVPTGTVDNTYKTAAALIVADTVGHRCRITAVRFNGADDAPPDLNVGVQIKRIADNSAGAAGTKTVVSAANMPKKDPGSIDSLVSGGVNYTVEPTTYEGQAIYQGGFNARGGRDIRFDEQDGESPVAIADQTLGLLVCPRGTTAIRLSGVISFETF
jgi:hypothetical protein